MLALCLYRCKVMLSTLPELLKQARATSIWRQEKWNGRAQGWHPIHHPHANDSTPYSSCRSAKAIIVHSILCWATLPFPFTAEWWCSKLLKGKDMGSSSTIWKMELSSVLSLDYLSCPWTELAWLWPQKAQKEGVYEHPVPSLLFPLSCSWYPSDSPGIWILPMLFLPGLPHTCCLSSPPPGRMWLGSTIPSP